MSSPRIHYKRVNGPGGEYFWVSLFTAPSGREYALDAATLKWTEGPCCLFAHNAAAMAAAFTAVHFLPLPE